VSTNVNNVSTIPSASVSVSVSGEGESREGEQMSKTVKDTSKTFLTVKDTEASKVEIPPESAFRQRLRALYGRRASTAWTPKERKVLATIEANPDALEELALIEKHYAAMKAGPKDKDYRRRDMQTLLNNWAGAVDRARNWQPPKRPVMI
jgi:hypothetical protein